MNEKLFLLGLGVSLSSLPFTHFLLKNLSFGEVVLYLIGCIGCAICSGALYSFLYEKE